MADGQPTRFPVSRRGVNRVFLSDRLKPVHEIGHALRMGSGLEDGVLVIFQNLEPALNIGCMVAARFWRQLKIGTQESGTEFGHKLFAGVAFVAPAFAPQIAVKTAGVLRPVSANARWVRSRLRSCENTRNAASAHDR